MNKPTVALSLAALLVPVLSVVAGDPPTQPATPDDAAQVEAQALDRLVHIAWSDFDAKQKTSRFLNAHQAHRDAVASLQQCQTCHKGPADSFLDYVGTVALQPKGPWIGVSVGPADPVLRSQLRLPEGAGVVVTQVVPEGPAQQAGIEQDDVLLSVNGKPVASGEDLDQILQSAGTGGAPLTLKLLHAGEAVEKQVTPRNEDYASFVEAHLTVARPTYRIGVVVNEPDQTLRRQLRLRDGGVVVSEVFAGKPAEAAGIKVGDVLLSANGNRLASQEELTEAVQQAAESPLELELMRGGVTLKIGVTPAKEGMGTMPAWDYVMKDLLLVRPAEAQVLLSDFNVALDRSASTKPSEDRLAEMAEHIGQLRASVDALRADLERARGGREGAK